MIQAWQARSRLSAKVIALLVVAAAFILSLSSPGTALAEAQLVKSSPAPGVLETSTGAPPQTVRLAFSERLNPRGSSLTALNVPGFEQVDLSDSHIDPDDPKALIVSLKPGLGPGKCMVRWTGVSAEDGGELSGEFGLVTFRTGEAPTPVPEPAKPAPANPEQTESSTPVPVGALLPAAGGFDIPPVLLFVIFSFVALIGGGLALPQHRR